MNNYEVYNERMALGIEDKLFFLSEIGDYLHTVVDFGCADATLGKALYKYNPDIQYVGIDNDEYMLENAEVNFPQGRYFLSLEDYLNDTGDYLDTLPFLKGTAIILSSVLHEVFSYNYTFDWAELTHFEYVVIRDMGLPQTSDYNKSVNFHYPLKTIIDYLDSDNIPIPYNIDTYSFGDYYQLWLKYKYTENWDREYNENYFACSQETVLTSLLRWFSITYHKSYVLPFIKEQVTREFGFNPFLVDTHYKIIAHNKIPF